MVKLGIACDAREKHSLRGNLFSSGLMIHNICSNWLGQFQGKKVLVVYCILALVPFLLGKRVLDP